MPKPELTLVLDGIRSIHNVGSIFRLADGLGAHEVVTTGITPHTKQEHDDRLPHVISRFKQQIRKTALGAEDLVPNRHFGTIETAIDSLRSEGYSIICLELTDNAKNLDDYIVSSKKIALVVGSETDGVSSRALDIADDIIAIPMCGIKNSLNVTSATSIAAYQLTKYPQAG